jgi:hypothetical protein
VRYRITITGKELEMGRGEAETVTTFVVAVVVDNKFGMFAVT